MNSFIWDEITQFYNTKTFKRNSNSNQIIKIGLEHRKIWNNFIHFKRQDFKICNIYNIQNFKKNNKINFFITDYFQKDFKKVFVPYFLNEHSCFFYSLKCMFLIKTSSIYKNFSRKYFNYNYENYTFFISEILILWNINTKISLIWLRNQEKLLVNFNKKLLFFHFKISSTFDLILEKKKLKYWSLDKKKNILPEISCQANLSLINYKFLCTSIRIFPVLIYFFQKIVFLRKVFLRPFSAEGTTFLISMKNLEHTKIFDIKEFFNKNPPNGFKTLLKTFFSILINKRYHQEIINVAFNKITDEKIISDNLSIIFKCLLKIQEKIKTAYISSVFFNLLKIYRENYDLILKNEDFFRFELQLPPINCNSIEKDLFNSVLNKEKAGKIAINIFFLNLTRNSNNPLYLKVFLSKILFRITKQPKHLVKNYLLEIILTIIRKNKIFFIKNRKNTQILKKHFSVILQKCKKTRLLFILQKKNLSKNLKKGIETPEYKNTLHCKKKDKVDKVRIPDTNLFSSLKFNEEI